MLKFLNKNDEHKNIDHLQHYHDNNDDFFNIFVKRTYEIASVFWCPSLKSSSYNKSMTDDVNNVEYGKL